MEESHTVARTFLKSFAAKLGPQRPGLVVFQKAGNLDAQVDAQDLKDARVVSTETDFYMLAQSDGVNDPLLEHSLATIEQHWPDFAHALRTPGVLLTAGQLGTLTAFAGLWEARSQRTVIALRQRFAQKIARERFQLQSTGLFGEPLEQALRAYILEHFDAHVMPNAAPTTENLALAAVPKLAKSNYEILRRLHIAVLTIQTPPNRRPLGFSTSDHPVAWIDTVVGNNANPCPFKTGMNVEVTFPLSKTKCLLYSFRPVLAEFDVDEAIVDIVNARTAVCALREVYAPPAATEADKERQLRSLRLETNPFESLSTRMPNAAGAPIYPKLLLLQAAASLQNDAE